MKAVHEKVEVETRDGCPVRLTWGERRYSISQVLDGWRYGGRWWLSENPRDCFLVQAGPLTAELHREAGPVTTWWLTRLQD